MQCSFSGKPPQFYLPFILHQYFHSTTLSLSNARTWRPTFWKEVADSVCHVASWGGELFVRCVSGRRKSRHNLSRWVQLACGERGVGTGETVRSTGAITPHLSVFLFLFERQQPAPAQTLFTFLILFG